MCGSSLAWVHFVTRLSDKLSEIDAAQACDACGKKTKKKKKLPTESVRFRWIVAARCRAIATPRTRTPERHNHSAILCIPCWPYRDDSPFRVTHRIASRQTHVVCGAHGHERKPKPANQRKEKRLSQRGGCRERLVRTKCSKRLVMQWRSVRKGIHARVSSFDKIFSLSQQKKEETKKNHKKKKIFFFLSFVSPFGHILFSEREPRIRHRIPIHCDYQSWIQVFSLLLSSRRCCCCFFWQHIFEMPTNSWRVHEEDWRRTKKEKINKIKTFKVTENSVERKRRRKKKVSIHGKSLMRSMAWMNHGKYRTQSMRKIIH